MKIAEQNLKLLIDKLVSENFKLQMESRKISPKKTKQLKNLAKLCAVSYKNHPELWVEETQFGSLESMFDFPEYGGLPKKISNKLSSDCVDVIQDYVFDVISGEKFSASRLYKRLKDYYLSGYSIP